MLVYRHLHKKHENAMYGEGFLIKIMSTLQYGKGGNESLLPFKILGILNIVFKKRASITPFLFSLIHLGILPKFRYLEHKKIYVS